MKISNLAIVLFAVTFCFTSCREPSERSGEEDVEILKNDPDTMPEIRQSIDTTQMDTSDVTDTTKTTRDTIIE